MYGAIFQIVQQQTQRHSTSQSTWVAQRLAVQSCQIVTQSSVFTFDASHISFTDEMGIVFNEHWINRSQPSLTKSSASTDNPPQALERFRTGLPQPKPGCPNASDSRQSEPDFLSLLPTNVCSSSRSVISGISSDAGASVSSCPA